MGASASGDRLSRRTLMGGSAAVAASAVVVAVAGRVAAADEPKDDAPAESTVIITRLLEAAPAGAETLIVDTPSGPLNVRTLGFPKTFAFEARDRVLVDQPRALAEPFSRLAPDGIQVTDNRLEGVEDRPLTGRPLGG